MQLTHHITVEKLPWSLLTFKRQAKMTGYTQLMTSKRQAKMHVWVHACKQSCASCSHTHEREKSEELVQAIMCIALTHTWQREVWGTDGSRMLGRSIHQLWMQLTHHIKVEKLPWSLLTFKWQNADIGSRIINMLCDN